MIHSICDFIDLSARSILGLGGSAIVFFIPSSTSLFAQVERLGEGFDQVMLSSGTFSNTTAKGKVKMFEFSGVATVGDKLIVIDNETGKLGRNTAGISDRFNEALFEVTFARNGEPKLKRAWSECFANAPAFDDLEGITSRDSYVYLMGSHSTDKEDAHRPERHVFLRLAIGTNAEPRPGTEVKIFNDLTEALLEWGNTVGLKTEELKAKGSKKKTTFIKNFDIEGLATVPGEPGLLLALRGPLQKKGRGEVSHAFVLLFENPDEVFEKKNAKPRLSTFATLNLKGQGISSMEYDRVSKSLLIATTDKNENQPIVSRLWQWSLPLKTSEPIERKTFTGKKLEGVARIPEGNQFEDSLLLAFDEEKESEQFGRLEVLRWIP